MNVGGSGDIFEIHSPELAVRTQKELGMVAVIQRFSEV